MSANNSVVVKQFLDGWRWAEVRGEIPEVDEDFINGPFKTCFDAQDDARAKLEEIEYGVDILRPSPPFSQWYVDDDTPLDSCVDFANGKSPVDYAASGLGESFKLSEWPLYLQHDQSSRIDFATAYVKIAPKVAEAWAYLECGQIKRASTALGLAMAFIEAVGQCSLVVRCGRESGQ